MAALSLNVKAAPIVNTAICLDKTMVYVELTGVMNETAPGILIHFALEGVERLMTVLQNARTVAQGWNVKLELRMSSRIVDDIMNVRLVIVTLMMEEGAMMIIMSIIINMLREVRKLLNTEQLTVGLYLILISRFMQRLTSSVLCLMGL